MAGTALDTNPPEFHLATLNRQIRDMMNFTLRPHGLKLVEWRVMQCLSEIKMLTICDLSTLAVIERTATSRLVDRLVDRKLVRKSAMANDRRFSQVSLTAPGKQLLNLATGDVAEVRERLFDGIAPDQIDAMLYTVEKMQANADNITRGGRAHPAPPDVAGRSY